MYAGNIGYSQSVELMVGAAQPVRRPDRRGVRRQRLGIGPGAAAADGRRPRGLDNIMFVGLQPKERLAEVLATGDIHTVLLRRGPRSFERAVEDVLDPRRRTTVRGVGRRGHRGRAHASDAADAGIAVRSGRSRCLLRCARTAARRRRIDGPTMGAQRAVAGSSRGRRRRPSRASYEDVVRRGRHDVVPLTGGSVRFRRSRLP